MQQPTGQAPAHAMAPPRPINYSTEVVLVDGTVIWTTSSGGAVKGFLGEIRKNQRHLIVGIDTEWHVISHRRPAALRGGASRAASSSRSRARTTSRSAPSGPSSRAQTTASLASVWTTTSNGYTRTTALRLQTRRN
jgi:hypothetical protein